MKNLILTLIAIVTVTFANAQTATEKKIASDFILTRTESFNKGIAPVYVSNIDSLEKTIDKKNVNYRVATFVFFGQVNDANCAGGSMNSYSKGRSQSFIYYTIKNEGDRTVISVISGHDGW